jgi:small subunit ribosomal protein S17
MADEEQKNEEQQEEQAPEETPAEEPQAEEQPQAEETPAKETPKEDEAPAGEADSNGSDAEPAEAEEASSDAGAEAEDASSDGEAEDTGDGGGPDELEGLDWKARRRLERSRQPAEPRPQQSPEERSAARAGERKKAAARRAAWRAKRRTKREAGTGTSPAERETAGRKTRQGRVVSSKPDKTITVAIEVARRHPQYEKIVRRSRTLHAHDAQNEAGEGDLVRVVETRPMSRRKRWRLVEILEKAK